MRSLIILFIGVKKKSKSAITFNELKLLFSLISYGQLFQSLAAEYLEVLYLVAILAIGRLSRLSARSFRVRRLERFSR